MKYYEPKAEKLTDIDLGRLVRTHPEAYWLLGMWQHTREEARESAANPYNLAVLPTC